MKKAETLSRLIGMEVKVFIARRSVGELILLARSLRSHEGENGEYDQALVDLVGAAANLTAEEDKPALARLMGIKEAL